MRFVIVTGMLMMVVALTGCSRDAEREYGVDEAAEDVREQTEKATKDAADIWDRVAGYTAEQSEALVSRLQEAGEDMRARAADWRERAGNSGEDAAERFDKAWDNFQDQLDGAGDATGDAWDETVRRVKSAWDDLKDAYNELRDAD